MLLNGCAQKLTTGKATGIDIWRERAAGGTYDDLMENAAAEGVSDRIEFKEMDARHMTFEDARFDVVVSSFALHHIGDSPAETEQAISEIVRVLKPGGRVTLIDIEPMINTAERVLVHSGMQSVRRDKVIGFHLVTAARA
jgi:ubiquinone/menaquinone biosynthesis C-methylase UbiE